MTVGSKKRNKKAVMKNLRKYYIMIFVFVFLIYGNSIKNNYSMDDNIVTVTTPEKPNNPRIEKGIKGIPEIFKSHYLESRIQSFDYRPLPLVTFAIEYQFFKSNPHISHFINVLLYALSCTLLFFILSTLLSTYHLVFPLLITLLFAAHPIHTEVVDSLKNRDELMSFFFCLCSLHYGIKYADKKKIMLIINCAIFFLLAMLSKKTAILFLVLIPLTVYFLKPIKFSKIFVFFFFLVISGVFFSLIKKTSLHGVQVERVFNFTENPLFFEHDFFKRIPAAFYVLGYYLKLMLAPFPLSAYYGYNAIPIAGWLHPMVWISLIIHSAVAVYAFINIQKKTVLSFGILFYLGAIFPFSNLLKPAVGIVAERFAYSASLGFCFVAANLLLSAFKIPFTNKNVKTSLYGSFIATVIVILLVCSFITISRNNKWKDELTLLRNDVKYFENSSNLHSLIGSTINEQLQNLSDGIKKNEMIREAALHYRKASSLMGEGIEKYPMDYINLHTIGTMNVNLLNDINLAQQMFQKVLAIKPDFEAAQFNLAFCYEKRNLPDSAILNYEKMVSHNTKALAVYLRLHQLYLSKGDFQKAIIVGEKAIQEVPQEIEPYVNLGNAYILNKDTLNGIKYFEKAVELAPSDNNLRGQTINFLKSAGYPEKARSLEGKSLSVTKH